MSDPTWPHDAADDPLFTPFGIGDVHLTNRAALSPMTRISATEDGLVTERSARFYAGFARGGFALIITEGAIGPGRSARPRSRRAVSSWACTEASKEWMSVAGVSSCAPHAQRRPCSGPRIAILARSTRRLSDVQSRACPLLGAGGRPTRMGGHG